MSPTNNVVAYSGGAKFFHWLIALLVIAMLTLGSTMHEFSDPTFRHQLFTVHKSLGLTILFLMVIRLLWRLISPPPPLPTFIPKWQRCCANLVHGLLYVILIAMPLSGIIMSTAANHPPSFWGLFIVSFPGISLSPAIAHYFSDVHAILAWVIMGLLAIHILAALKHYLEKNGVFERMWPFKINNFG